MGPAISYGIDLDLPFPTTPHSLTFDRGDYASSSYELGRNHASEDSVQDG